MMGGLLEEGRDWIERTNAAFRVNEPPGERRSDYVFGGDRLDALCHVVASGTIGE
ncbi:MAG: hypothetical protein A49_23800 [Methyloceanibacter sp.]|nr:MAG: hypothetical protein A49_23800 [Methyloceanibacter sp.]